MSNVVNTIAQEVLGNLKRRYQGPIKSQFNDDMPVLKHMQRGTEKWAGTSVFRPLKLRRNQGIGAASDGGVLPATGKQTTVQAEIPCRFNYLRFALTAPLMKASQTQDGAFVSQLSYEMEEGLNDLKNDVNRQLTWTGRGDLAVVAANAVATNSVSIEGRTSGEDAAKFLDIGMEVDIVTTAGVVQASRVTITAISTPLAATSTLTLDQNVTVAADSIVVRAGAFNQEIQGFRASLDGLTTSLYGIDRATYWQYQGNVVDAGGVALRLDLLTQALSQARRRGGLKLDMTMTNHDAERMYDKLLVADKRYIGERIKGDGTFTRNEESYLALGGKPVVADKDMPLDFYHIGMDGFKLYVLTEFEFASESGAELIALNDVDGYEARLRYFANIFAEKPSALARLTNFVSP